MELQCKLRDTRVLWVWQVHILWKMSVTCSKTLLRVCTKQHVTQTCRFKSHNPKVPWSSSEIRKQFIDFFCNRDHLFVQSSSVLPLKGEGTYFTNAGMNQVQHWWNIGCKLISQICHCYQIELREMPRSEYISMDPYQSSYRNVQKLYSDDPLWNIYWDL